MQRKETSLQLRQCQATTAPLYTDKKGTERGPVLLLTQDNRTLLSEKKCTRSTKTKRSARSSHMMHLQFIYSEKRICGSLPPAVLPHGCPYSRRAPGGSPLRFREDPALLFPRVSTCPCALPCRAHPAPQHRAQPGPRAPRRRAVRPGLTANGLCSTRCTARSTDRLTLGTKSAGQLLPREFSLILELL